MKKLLIVITLLFSVKFIFAQGIVPCVTDELYHQSLTQYPQLKQIELEANTKAAQIAAALPQYKTSSIKYIPVVFHIIHQSGPENIAEAQILDELRIMNEDYRKNPVRTDGSTDTNPLSVDMQIEFRLAQYDPNGKKSDGVERISSTLTNNATDAVKALSYWDSNRYLNVWVVSSISNSIIGGGSGEVLGYAQLPPQRATQPTLDGIVVRSDQLGNLTGSFYTSMTSQAGRTLTHEAGHWVGLYHPFQPDNGQSTGCGSSNITSSNCNTTGDWVCDTPPVSTPTSGCPPATQNTCHNDVPDLPDLVSDYMDYADGSCMNLFTSGQKNRVYAISFTGAASSTNRINAVSTSNLNSVGLDGNGNYLSFTPSTIKAPYHYDFENTTLANDGWVLNNFNDPTNGWQIKSGVSQKGSSCIALGNFNNSTINARDGFQSPEIDITTLQTPYLNFYYAYAQKSSATNDILNIMISDSFGIGEQTIFSSTGMNLTTGGTVSNEFTPNSSQWKLVNIDLSSFKFYNNARIRFEFICRKGNDIYIDNLSITNGAFTGIEGAVKQDYNFNFQPNPMNESANISFNLKKAEQIKITVIDVIGREVSVIQNSELQSGVHSININKNDLKAGVYFLRFNSDQNMFTHKFVIN